MATVLITGGAGFLGSHLCDRFLADGWDVIAMDTFITGVPDNIAHLLGRPGFRFIKYDVTQYIFLDGPVNLILHFACPASPADYLRYKIHTMKVDSLGTLHTLGLAKAKGARFVLASTSEVYGNPEVHPQPETYWGNVNPIGPRSVYDEAKRFSEALSMAYYHTHAVDVRIARIFNVYGERMRMDDGRAVPTFIVQALQGRPMTVYGNGTQTRSFCEVSDLVEGVSRLATTTGLDGEVVNLGNPDEYTIVEIAEYIKQIAGSGSEIVHEPLPTDDPERRRPDITKAEQLLGWRPRVPLREGLERTLAYFRRRLQGA